MPKREGLKQLPEYEERLDQLFYEAFDANHPAMHDYALLKMELKKLRANTSPSADQAMPGGATNPGEGKTSKLTMREIIDNDFGGIL